MGLIAASADDALADARFDISVFARSITTAPLRTGQCKAPFVKIAREAWVTTGGGKLLAYERQAHQLQYRAVQLASTLWKNWTFLAFEKHVIRSMSFCFDAHRASICKVISGQVDLSAAFITSLTDAPGCLPGAVALFTEAYDLCVYTRAFDSGEKRRNMYGALFLRQTRLRARLLHLVKEWPQRLYVDKLGVWILLAVVLF